MQYGKGKNLNNISERGIYKITFPNNKCYVGISKNPKVRYTSHRSLCSRGKHTNAEMQSIYDEYGYDDWVFEVLSYDIGDDEYHSNMENKIIAETPNTINTYDGKWVLLSEKEKIQTLKNAANKQYWDNKTQILASNKLKRRGKLGDKIREYENQLYHQPHNNKKQRERAKEYYKALKAKNPNINKERYSANREAISKRNKEKRRGKEGDAIREYERQYRQKNRERQREKAREYYHKNKERQREKAREYYRKNYAKQ